MRILIKMPWEKENVQKVQPPRYLAGKTGPWGAYRSGTPSSWCFLSKIENLCENHICWAFFISLEKKLLVIFWTLCYKIFQFFLRFSPKLVFDKIFRRYKQKLLEIYFQIEFETFFVYTFGLLDQKQILVKNFKKWTILPKQSPKNY